MSISSELESLLGNFIVKRDGDYGVEIETEVVNSSAYPEGLFQGTFYPNKGHNQCDDIRGLKNWEVHTDNSLRNYGLEFVTKTPLSFQGIVEELQNFSKVMEGVPFLTDAPATSVHLHVNFQNENYQTLANFLTVYILLENVLMEISGRRSNLFALPIRVAGNIIPGLSYFFKRISYRHSPCGIFNQQSYKYGAMNISNLPYKNSLEFRAFRGTTNTEDIIEWISLFEGMKKFSRQDIVPADILESIQYNRTLLADELIPSKFHRQILSIKEMVDFNLFDAMSFVETLPDVRMLNTLWSSSKKTKSSLKTLSNNDGIYPIQQHHSEVHFEIEEEDYFND